MMNAVATLLYNPDYLPGALVLGFQLRKLVKGNTKLVVLIDSEKFSPYQLHLLADLYDELLNISIFESHLYTKLNSHLKRPELAKTYSKVQLWSLPYEKVLYLDADTLPLLGNGAVTDLLELKFPKGKILAAPDSGFPDIFNSGVFLLKPNPEDYEKLVDLAASGQDVSFDGADQGLLNQYFNSDPDWVSQTLKIGEKNKLGAGSSNWVPVPFLYNTTPSAQYQYLPAFNHFGPRDISKVLPENAEAKDIHGYDRPENVLGEDISSSLGALLSYHSAASTYFASTRSTALVKLLHFIGPIKPWKSSSSGLFAKWWEAWNEYSRGKLVLELLDQIYPVSVKALITPENTESPQKISGADLSTSQVYNILVYHPPKEFTPAELCNPENYHISQPNENSLVSWDATREEPPQEKPQYQDFDEDLKAYGNQWDEFEGELEKEVVEEVLEEKFVEEEVKEEQEDIQQLIGPEAEKELQIENSEYGYYPGQVAERVFTDLLDYMPLHCLLVKQEKPSGEPEIEKKLENLELSEDEEEPEQELERENIVYEEPEVEGSEPESHSGVPKLFPWEFRDDNYQPEREF